MKSRIAVFFLSMYLVLSISNISAENANNSTKFFTVWKSKEMKSIKFDDKYKPSQYEINAIYFILKNTSEVHIHQMRDENKNQVMIKTKKENGGYPEAVFDKNGNIVTNSYNKGSFNYFLYTKDPLKHFGVDILPWLVLGNAKDDPTTFNERLYYYLQDLNRGIQHYIFKAKANNIEKINFKKLDKNEQMTIRFFSHLLFNNKYKIKLNEKNRNKLIKSSDFYWSYYYQIHDLLGYKRK